jgi:hypothetical protein
VQLALLVPVQLVQLAQLVQLVQLAQLVQLVQLAQLVQLVPVQLVHLDPLGKPQTILLELFHFYRFKLIPPHIVPNNKLPLGKSHNLTAMSATLV